MLQLSSIKVSHLYKSFVQGMQTTTVLDDVNVTFERGRTYALTGVSGTGKSTLIHLLAGLDTPQSGSIFYDDQDIFQLESGQRQFFLKKNVGLIFQTPSLIHELSIVENVMLKGLIAHQNYKQAHKKASLLLEKVGLSHKAESAPSLLSGGEQQRVAVARALFTEPTFILADEPTAHLDEETTTTIIDLLLACQQEWHMGLIVASHDVVVAERLQTVLRLDKGALIESLKTMGEFVTPVGTVQIEIF